MHDADEFSASPGVATRIAQIDDEPQVNAVMAAGGVIAFPTETVWGLGVAAAQPSFVARLRHRKGREAGKPFQLLCADTDTALSLVAANSQDRLAALSAFWPGPLTLVVPASPSCPPWLTSDGAVGLRVPDHRLTRRLAVLAGGYLVGSSLNRSGEAPATTQAQALASGLADLLIAGEAARGVPSTVFDAGRGVVLRPGGVPENALLEAWRCAP